MITTTDPRTGSTVDTAISMSHHDDVERATLQADRAFAQLAAFDREWRASLLDALADGLEADREALVSTADAETGLGLARLDGELTRSVLQFRLFAEALREGSYLEAAIDHAAETPMGQAPDVRRMLVPIGPVAVFGSSNFPFAFSVAGGDTASALAAGCPVVLKAHSSHPLTSHESFESLARAARDYGAPDGTLGIVFGTQAGATLVADDRIHAVGFTGSLSGGQALMDIVSSRPRPIPFYGEMSSLNPLIITEAAAKARADSIAEGLFGSFTASAGQLCTKPGVAFVPNSAAGRALVASLSERVTAAPAQVLLNQRIHESFGAITARIVDQGGAVEEARGASIDEGFAATPSLLTTAAADMTSHTTEEAFGPLLVIAYYDGVDDLQHGLAHVPNSLTCTIHCEDAEPDRVASLVELVQPHVGRIVFNGFPTGVRVSWAQHHGGPWPATNSLHTSVGVTAVRRFLRPLVWQNAPESLLPMELRDDYRGVPRRVDGTLALPSV